MGRSPPSLTGRAAKALQFGPASGELTVELSVSPRQLVCYARNAQRASSSMRPHISGHRVATKPSNTR
jgi:hypothetical protein